MGRKVNPRIFRIGVNQDWKSKWFQTKDFSKYLEQDIRIRKFLKNRLREAGVSDIKIERSAGDIKINIFTSRPGIVIGRGGAGIEALRKEIKKTVIRDSKNSINLNIQEVDNPNLDAQIVCNGVIEQIEKRIPFRRVMKQTIDQVIRAGAKGVRVSVAGRLNGVEIARTEKLSQGRVPLQTLRSDVDYARGTAFTTYGSIGVKVWIYKGEVFKKDKKSEK